MTIRHRDRDAQALIEMDEETNIGYDLAEARVSELTAGWVRLRPLVLKVSCPDDPAEYSLATIDDVVGFYELRARHDDAELELTVYEPSETAGRLQEVKLALETDKDWSGGFLTMTVRLTFADGTESTGVYTITDH